MQWVLISTIEQSILLHDENKGWQPTTVQPGTVINLILYDGTSEYEPPEGSRLLQIEDTVTIGDVVNL